MRSVLLLVVVAVLAFGSCQLRGDTEQAAAAPPPTSEELPIPPDAPTIEVLIVDAVTGQPAPGVEVLWITRVQYERAPTIVHGDLDPLSPRIEPAEAYGWHTRSGPDGLVRLAAPGSVVRVVARDERRYGTGLFAANAASSGELHRLELREDCTLRAHVTDAAGADVEGVRIGMIAFDPGDERIPRFRGFAAFESDAAGIVTFEHAQYWITVKGGPRRGEKFGAVQLAICMPGIESVPVQFDTAAMPTDPVELQMPACGEVHVRVLFEGQTLPEPREMALCDLARGPEGPLPDELAFPVDSMAESDANHATVDASGVARFRHVGLGREYCVGPRAWKVRVPGPTAPGQVATTTIDLADYMFALSGQVRDELGPVADGEVRFRSNAADCTFVTDDAGNFLLLQRQMHQGESTLDTGDMTFELRRAGQPTRRCKVASRTMHPGRNDLGELQLVVEPLIVGARLVFDCANKSAATSIERYVPDYDPGEHGTWTKVEGLCTTTSAPPDKTLEVRGTVEPGRYRLVVQQWEFLPVEPVEFALGSSDVEVHIRCGHQVDASCMLREDIDPAALELRLVPAGEKTDGEATTHAAHEKDDLSFARSMPRALRQQRACFVWPAVADGTYTLRIAVAGAKPVLEIPDIVVPLPEGGDARLRDIDLLSRLTQLHLVVKRPIGSMAEIFLTAFLLPQADQRHWRGSLLQTDLMMTVPSGPQDLLIAGDGWVTELHGVEGEVEVQPESLPTATLTVIGCERLPDGFSLHVRTEDDAAEDQRTFSARSRSGRLSNLLHPGAKVERGLAAVPVVDGATWIHVELRCGADAEPLHELTPKTVRAGEKVTVELSYDEVHAAIARLRDRAGK